jgi:hypothetical protein
MGRIQLERRVRSIGRLAAPPGPRAEGEESRPAGPTAGFRPIWLELKENSFYFSNCFIICKLI